MMRKYVLIAVVALSAIVFPLFAEGDSNTIGIYLEEYEDSRSENFLSEVMVMKSQPLLADPTFYRNQYCNFDLVTPTLTLPGYPLDGPAKSLVGESMFKALETFLKTSGWSVGELSGFTGGTLGGLLDSAESDGLDFVLVMRYTVIRYFIPVEAYRENSWAGSSGIITGDLQVGLGYIPALELYDTETGAKLWHSAYHAAQHGGSTDKNFIANVAAAGEFFTEFDISSNENKAAWAAAELTEDFNFIWSEYDVDERAAETMIEIAVKGTEPPFPKPADTGVLDAASKTSGLKHLFWTDFPSYRLHGTKWGIGYTLDYIGEYGIFYRDNTEAYPTEVPVEKVLTIENLLMHWINVPVYSIAFGNLSIDPVLSYGTTIPEAYDIHYDDIKGDGMGGYYVTPTDDTADIRISSFKLDLSVKYSFRLGDRFSVFLGGSGSISSWWEDIECEEADHDEIIEAYDAPYVNYDADLLLNASVTAGLRFDIAMPLEIFASYYSVTPGGSPGFAAGLRWIPMTWGWTEPYQKTVSDVIPIF